MAKEYDKLIKIYADAEKKLITDIELASTKGSLLSYKKRLLKTVQKTLKELRTSSRAANREIINASYLKGLQEVLKALNVSSGINAQAYASQISSLCNSADDYYNVAISQVGRRLEDAIRQTAADAAGKKFSEMQTLRQMKASLLDTLKGINPAASDGRIGVETKNGRVISLKAYAATVARTTTREAQNKAKFNQCLSLGVDLVQCSTHFPTCEVCAMYQGRVYALTKEAADGKYKGPDGKPLNFPYIYDTVLVDGYYTIHPNCRHVFLPFVTEAYTAKQLAEYSDASTKAFDDTRSDKERKAYAAEQANNRRRREDLRQYERYKATLGDKAPKTFASFRSMKVRNGEAWDKLQEEYRFAGTINRIIKHNPGISVFNTPDEIPPEYSDSVKAMTSVQKDGIYDYSNYRIGVRMNKYLGGVPGVSLTPQEVQSMNIVQEALKNSSIPYDTVLWRGAESAHFDGFDKLPKNLSKWPGNKITYKGFSSTSAVKNASYMDLEEKDLQMVIIKRGGTGGAAYIEDISYNKINKLKNEYEVLLQNDAKFVIIEAQIFRDKYILVLEAR